MSTVSVCFQSIPSISMTETWTWAWYHLVTSKYLDGLRIRKACGSGELMGVWPFEGVLVSYLK